MCWVNCVRDGVYIDECMCQWVYQRLNECIITALKETLVKFISLSSKISVASWQCNFLLFLILCVFMWFFLKNSFPFNFAFSLIWNAIDVSQFRTVRQMKGLIANLIGVILCPWYEFINIFWNGAYNALFAYYHFNSCKTVILYQRKLKDNFTGVKL